MITDDVELKSGKQLTVVDLKAPERMIIEADPFAGLSTLRVDNTKYVRSHDSAGVQRCRKLSDAE